MKYNFTRLSNELLTSVRYPYRLAVTKEKTISKLLFKFQDSFTQCWLHNMQSVGCP